LAISARWHCAFTRCVWVVFKAFPAPRNPLRCSIHPTGLRVVDHPLSLSPHLALWSRTSNRRIEAMCGSTCRLGVIALGPNGIRDGSSAFDPAEGFTARRVGAPASIAAHVGSAQPAHEKTAQPALGGGMSCRWRAPVFRARLVWLLPAIGRIPVGSTTRRRSRRPDLRLMDWSRQDPRQGKHAPGDLLPRA
jgi:hypothetical protein